MRDNLLFTGLCYLWTEPCLPFPVFYAMLPIYCANNRITRCVLTFLSEVMSLKASVTWWAVAPPPTSRKLAGVPPWSLMMSMVAMARPAPFTTKNKEQWSASFKWLMVWQTQYVSSNSFTIKRLQRFDGKVQFVSAESKINSIGGN